MLLFVSNKAQEPVELLYQFAVSVSSSASSTVTFNKGVVAIPVDPSAGPSPV